LDGHHGAKPERKHRTETEAIDIIVSRPYAPAGAKKKGEGVILLIVLLYEILQNGQTQSSDESIIFCWYSGS